MIPVFVLQFHKIWQLILLRQALPNKRTGRTFKKFAVECGHTIEGKREVKGHLTL
jgi:hypothetical protein